MDAAYFLRTLFDALGFGYQCSNLFFFYCSTVKMAEQIIEGLPYHITNLELITVTLILQSYEHQWSWGLSHHVLAVAGFNRPAYTHWTIQITSLDFYMLPISIRCISYIAYHDGLFFCTLRHAHKPTKVQSRFFVINFCPYLLLFCHVFTLAI